MSQTESIVQCPFCRIPVTTAGGWPFVASMLLIHFEKCTPTMSDGERRNESVRLASAHMTKLAHVA